MTTLKQKIQSMKCSEIVKSMIDGLKNVTEKGLHVDMSTFGRKAGNICFGCAATACVLEIGDLNAKDLEIEFFSSDNLQLAFETFSFEDFEFISVFEMAINGLRMGSIEIYNKYAKEIEISTLNENYAGELPYLSNFDYEENLYCYEDYYEFLLMQEKLANQD